MLWQRQVPKAKKSITETLPRYLHWAAAEQLVLFEKLQRRGAFNGVGWRDLLRVENIRMSASFCASYHFC